MNTLTKFMRLGVIMVAVSALLAATGCCDKKDKGGNKAPTTAPTTVTGANNNAAAPAVGNNAAAPAVGNNAGNPNPQSPGVKATKVEGEDSETAFNADAQADKTGQGTVPIVPTNPETTNDGKSAALQAWELCATSFETDGNDTGETVEAKCGSEPAS